MKNKIIGVLVAAVIVFMIQALSWMISPIHEGSFKYNPNQETIMEVLKENMEDGRFMIPNMEDPKGDQEACWAEHMGQPWAVITFHSSMEDNMGRNMGIGFILVLLSMLIVTGVLFSGSAVWTTFLSRWLLVMNFAFIVILAYILPTMLWMHIPWHFISGEVIDMLLSFGLAGVWLAWWVGRNDSSTASVSDSTTTTE